MGGEDKQNATIVKTMNGTFSYLQFRLCNAGCLVYRCMYMVCVMCGVCVVCVVCVCGVCGVCVWCV